MLKAKNSNSHHPTAGIYSKGLLESDWGRPLARWPALGWQR